MNKTYEPKSFEERIYKEWEDGKYFSAMPSDKPPFTIVIPPPNITGQLHMGHALNETIQDAIIRYKRMMGFEALWLPGTDHASIATEVKIVEKMKAEGLTKEDVGREGFLKRAYEWKDQYGGRIIEQLKKLGNSCDWDRLAFTMDERCSKAVTEVFVNLYNKGLVYQGNRIINWCPECGTAISDAEVEYEQTDSHLWHIKYPIENSEDFIVVATTRPETMLGDTAVAVNPKDARYKSLVGKNIVLPLANRLIPIIEDDYVDMEFGTGVVKITPAHDPNDFEVGLRHNLAVLRVLNDDATINFAGKYNGLDRYEARKRMVADLTDMGLMVKIEKHVNNVGHCYRCHNVIEPIVSKQWFVKMSPLAQPAIDAVKNKEVKFNSKRFEKTYMHWMENIRDWCISRQLWWGHRIPAYYCETCGEMVVSKTAPTTCAKCGGKFRQDEDVLDTWFSSALWPFATLGYPEKTKDLEFFYPTNVLVTAYDIIFFWVARMIFSGIEHMGAVPFTDVLIHGIVRDANGKKMSKSLGNGVDPLEMVDKYGADSLRFSLVHGISSGGDIRFSEDKIEGFRNFMNKIWNASRFVMLNSENVAVKSIDSVSLSLADKWILSRLNTITAEVIKYMDKYEVGQTAAKLYEFVWNDYCDWYLELAKTALYSDDDSRRESAVATLNYTLDQILRLIHPIAPFVTQEIFTNLPLTKGQNIIRQDFPRPDKKHAFVAYRKKMELVMDIIKAIRNMRSEMNVSQSKRTKLYLQPKDGYNKLIQETSSYICKLGMGTELTIVDKAQEKSASIVLESCAVYIPMGEMIDFAKERERLLKEQSDYSNEIKRGESKLANVGFLAKAPKSLIDEETEKLERNRKLLAEVAIKLSELQE